MLRQAFRSFRSTSLATLAHPFAPSVMPSPLSDALSFYGASLGSRGHHWARQCPPPLAVPTEPFLIGDYPESLACRAERLALADRLSFAEKPRGSGHRLEVNSFDRHGSKRLPQKFDCVALGCRIWPGAGRQSFI